MSETENVNRKWTKRWFSNFVWFVVFIGAAFGALKAVSQDSVLPVREISITGEFKQIAENDLHALVVNGVAGNFFTFDVEEIYRKFYAMPWVEKIWVHRVWPDKINIELREHRAVAILEDKGLLNDKGQVFISDAQQFEKQLPVFLIASQYEQQAIKVYRAYKKMLQAAGLKIKRFNFDGRKSQRLFLENGVELKLGRTDTVKRLQRFIVSYRSLMIAQDKEIEVVDLRYTNGFAVRWKQV